VYLAAHKNKNQQQNRQGQKSAAEQARTTREGLKNNEQSEHHKIVSYILLS
jgi:hypothetical protein